MRGQINTTFGTFQADLFESGLAAQIGANPFIVWCAIKSHSDFNNGICYPGIRCLMQKTGLASSTVQNALKSLQELHLLRSWKKRNRRYYVARERLDVKIGDRTLCTIVIDYVPAIMRKQLSSIKSALESGKTSLPEMADVEIIPGPDFSWDQSKRVLHASIPPAEIAASPPSTHNPYAQRIQELATRANQSVKI